MPHTTPHQEIRELLGQWHGMRLAILFGSLAKGTERPDSDIDLAVDLGRPLTSDDTLALIDALAQLTGRPIDLIDLRRVGEPLLGEILAHGTRLIGSDDDYCALVLKHIYNNEDFVPLQRRILRERREAWLRS